LATLTDIAAKTNGLLADKEGGSGNEKLVWTKRFPIQKQTFIRFASVTIDKMIPLEPSEEYLSLLETKKEHVLSVVQHGIAIQRGGSQVIDNAFATALYTGIFYNTEGNGNPKGLSIFFAGPSQSVDAKSTMGAEELNIRIKAGVFSAGQLTALTTSVPSTVTTRRLRTSFHD